MLKFLKANMGVSDTPIRPAIKRSHQVLFQKDDAKAIGMHWFRASEPSISQNIIWHNGGTGGYRSFLGFTEDGQCGIVVLSNTARSVDELAWEILVALASEAGA